MNVILLIGVVVVLSMSAGAYATAFCYESWLQKTNGPKSPIAFKRDNPKDVRSGGKTVGYLKKAITASNGYQAEVEKYENTLTTFAIPFGSATVTLMNPEGVASVIVLGIPEWVALSEVMVEVLAAEENADA